MRMRSVLTLMEATLAHVWTDIQELARFAAVRVLHAISCFDAIQCVCILIALFQILMNVSTPHTIALSLPNVWIPMGAIRVRVI